MNTPVAEVIYNATHDCAKIRHITKQGGVLALQPEQQARGKIDVLLKAAGWHVCDAAAANIHAARGVAIREFPLKSGHGFADYLLYVNSKAARFIDAKKNGVNLVSVNTQYEKTPKGWPQACHKLGEIIVCHS